MQNSLFKPFQANTVLQKTLPLWFGVLFLCFSFALPVSSYAKPSKPQSVATQYKKAKKYYKQLRKNSRKAKYRDKWLTGIEKFQNIVSANKDHELVPSCYYMLGKMYSDLYHWSGSPLDLGFSISYYEDVVSRFPGNRLADDSLYKIGEIYLKKQKNMNDAARTFARVIALYPAGDMADDAAKQLKKIKAANPEINGLVSEDYDQASDSGETGNKASFKPIKYWSNPDYTRVVLEASSKVTYKENLLDPNGDRPRRLYIDLKNCFLPKNFPKKIPIQDGLLRQVRCAQFSPTTVRVVLDTQSFSGYKIFSLNNPYRIVIDVEGVKKEKKIITASKTKSSITLPTLPQQLGLGVQKIVIDPGHGGKDSGAIGPRGLKEKHVVLKVAKKLGKKLQKKFNCEIIFTRDRDIFIPLEERTAIANKNEGDLFISIHANAAPDRNARGVETYFLSFAKSDEAMRVAARENATTTHEISDLNTILASLLQSNFQTESIKLAEYIQENMVSGLRKKYRKVNNLGVKPAPFVVLIGAQMPAILAEISFISNPAEAKRLRSNRYLDVIADQLVTGISKYISDLNVATLRLQ